MPNSQPPTTQPPPPPRFHLMSLTLKIEAPTHWTDERAANVMQRLEDMWKGYAHTFQVGAYVIDDELHVTDVS
jgi:hypothetical protein